MGLAAVADEVLEISETRVLVAHVGPPAGDSIDEIDALDERYGMSLTASLKHSHDLFLNELYKLEDSQEGLRAILEKRKPQWKNR